MHFETTLADRVIHLLVFVVGAAAAGALALFVVGRLTLPGRGLVRPMVVVALVAATIGLFVLERIYHLVY